MANRFWVGGSGTWDASATTHWSTSTGGASGASAPTAADDVFINANSGGGTITISGALCRSLDCTNAPATTLSWSSTTLTVGDASGGAFKLVANITISNTSGQILFASTSDNGGTGWAITTANKAMPITHWQGVGGKWVLQDTSNFNGTFFLDNGTFDFNGKTVTLNTLNSNNSNTRTLTLGAAALTITTTSNALNFATTTGLTITTNTASITASGAGANLSVNGINMQGASVTITGSSVGFISGTWANVTRTGTAAKTCGLQLSGNLTCTGTFTANGNSAINRLLISTLDGVGVSYTLTAATVTVTNSDFMDITGAGAGSWNLSAITGLSGDCGGNTNITFTTPATQTHTTAAGGSWSTAAVWTSRVPLPQDNVVVNANTSGTLTADMPRLGKDLTFTGFVGTLSVSVAATNYGSLTLVSGMTFTCNNVWTFSGRSSHTVTSGTKTFGSDVHVDCAVGTYTLADAFGTITANNAIFSVDSGSFDSGSNTMTIGGFRSPVGTASSSATFGTSTVNLTRSDAGSMFNVNGSTFTLSAASATFVISTTATVTRTWNGAAQSFGTLTYTVAGSTGQLTLTASDTFGTINFSDATNARTLSITHGKTITVTTFNVNGTSGKLMTINSDSAGVAATLSKASGLVINSYLSIQDSTATGGAGWYALNSTNVSGNTGWIFNAAAPANVNGVGTVQSAVAVVLPTPAVVGGTGTVQTTVPSDLLFPTLVSGTGSLQTVALAAPVALVAGTGTVQSPTIVTNLSATATPTVVAGTGTVQSATLIDTLFPGLLSGTGTVQAAVEIATPRPAVVAGTGTVQTSTEVDTRPSGFIAGAGTVQGYDGYLAKPHSVSVAGTPDALHFAINNELDVRIRFAADNWSSGLNGPYLLSKYRVTGGFDPNSSWYLGMDGNLLTLETACGDGTNSRSDESNAGITASNGEILWLRATYRAADGRVQFFTAPGSLRNPGVSDWTQLGTDITRIGFDLLHISTADVVVGLDFPAGGDYFSSSNGGPRGKVYAVEIRDGIDGTVVASPDWSRRASSTATITDAQGNVWTKNPYSFGAGDPAGFAGGDCQVLGSYPTEKAVALPAAVIGSGTVLAPAETEVVGTVSGVGTAQSSVVVASVVPSVIAGVGTIQTILGLTVAFPGIVGGIGTVQSPTDMPAGVISAISGLGSMDLATLSVAAILDVLAGVGTVESPTISTGLSTTVTPSEIAGVGVVQAAVVELVGPATEISGVGLVEGVRSLISRTTVQVDGTGVVQGFTVVTAVPLGQISGIGTIATVSVETIGFPATITALGTVESPVARSLSVVSVIVGAGSIDVLLIETAAKPAALLGVGSVDTPGVTTSNALLVTVLVGVGSIESGVVLSPILDTPRVPIKWVLGIGEVETPFNVLDAPLLAIEGTGYFGFTTIFVGVFVAIGITVSVAKRQAAISVSDRSMTISASERQITTAPIDGLGINSG